MNECKTCKYFEQGETHSFCGHPKQKDIKAKDYVYYSDSCGLHEVGMAESRCKYIATLNRSKRAAQTA
jgi:hypothetical protein